MVITLKNNSKRVARPAFTMVELIFVIVILGVLSAIAIPRLAASRDDAEIVKGRSDVASIRSGIVLTRSQNMLQGNTGYPNPLDTATAGNDGDQLFTNVLDYPIYARASSGHWKKDDNDTYSFSVNNSWTSFDYNVSNGNFDCNHGNQNCKDLTE